MIVPPPPENVLDFLVPTDLERARLEAAWERIGGQSPVGPSRHRSLAPAVRWHTVGIGLVDSAAGTAGVLAERLRQPHSDSRVGDAAIPGVWLLGIAGSFDVDRAPLGSAVRVEQTVVDGIGVGNHWVGDDFRGLDCLGWPTPGRRSVRPTAPPPPRELPLVASGATATPDPIVALSVASASANVAEAAWRLDRHRSATLEDMETASVVAVAAAMNQPLAVVRGITNRVGDRDHANWHWDDAVDAVVAMVWRTWTGDKTSRR